MSVSFALSLIQQSKSKGGETSGVRTVEYIDHCHPNSLMYKLLTSTECECGLKRIILINDHDAGVSIPFVIPQLRGRILFAIFLT